MTTALVLSATLALTLGLGSQEPSGPGAAGSARAEAPWRAAGLTDRQAAAHALDRLAYGARPGEVDRVLEHGLERWIEDQIVGRFDDSELQARLAGLDALGMSAREMTDTFPSPAELARRVDDDLIAAFQTAASSGDDGARRRARAALLEAMRTEGVRPLRELLGQLMAQKVLRAALAENQLHEVLTDFWFNHFNVSLTDNQTRPWILAYERDAIGPRVVGDFRELLGATARHPAMLYYLDNGASRASADALTELERTAREMRVGESRGVGAGARRGGQRARRGAGTRPGGRPRPGETTPAPAPRAQRRAPSAGLNENYARELLELHTLGVDGGYTQDDVVDVARAFTGWTVLPSASRRRARGGMASASGDPLAALGPQRRRVAEQAGFLVDGDFLFHPGFHDAEPKRLLGEKLGGRGIEEGERVLDRLATHPSTARHLASKLAIRFVSDQPPEALVERLARRFLETDGDLAAVLRELVASREFWASRGEKIKTPFELAVSAVRATDASIGNPRGLIEWITRMGQPLYAYQDPTGYPDVAEHWVSSGALLNRMSFGLALAEGRIAGVRIRRRPPGLASEPAARGDGDPMEPTTRREALAAWGAVLLPERDLSETLDLLEPMAASPDLAAAVDQALPTSGETPPPTLDALLADPGESGGPDLGEDLDLDSDQDLEPPEAAAPFDRAQAIGLLLGSPEFQRR